MIGIDTITVGGSEDRRLVLQTAMVGRKISGSWNTLLIGVRVVNEFIATNIYAPVFHLGVMTTPSAGMTNGPLAGANAAHFLGIGSAEAVWTRSTTTINHYSGTASMQLQKIVDGVETNTTPSFGWIRSADDTKRYAMFVEIIKGSPNYTVTACVWNQAAGSVDITKAQMLTAMGSASIAAVDTYMDTLTANAYSATSAAIAVDEGTDGALDSICVSWNRAYPKLYVSDLMYRVLA
jgi:hypothetical protein